MINLETETITNRAKQLIVVIEKTSSKFRLKFENLKNTKRIRDTNATILNI